MSVLIQTLKSKYLFYQKMDEQSFCCCFPTRLVVPPPPYRGILASFCFPDMFSEIQEFSPSRPQISTTFLILISIKKLKQSEHFGTEPTVKNVVRICLLKYKDYICCYFGMDPCPYQLLVCGVSLDLLEQFSGGRGRGKKGNIS